MIRPLTRHHGESICTLEPKDELDGSCSRQTKMSYIQKNGDWLGVFHLWQYLLSPASQ